jgi:MFS family permease
MATCQRIYARKYWLNGTHQNMAALSAARGLAEIGHAMACPAASGIIATYFPQGRPRTLAFAALAGCGSIGSGIGWDLGGVLGDVE